MNTLKLGTRGPLVSGWQTFLTGQGLPTESTGTYDEATRASTRRYQKRHGLKPDGNVGNFTLGQAMRDGYALVEDRSDSRGTDSQFYPPRPANLRPLSDAARIKLFGPVAFTPAGTRGNPERVTLSPKWTSANIVRVKTPELADAPVGVAKPRAEGGKAVSAVQLNRAVAGQFSGLLQAWRDAGLLDQLLSWNGSFVPRFIRGSRTSLSNHSWGTAFDINVNWNRLKTVPALAGEQGSVRALVPLANQYGFYWGGHYDKRLDGMHFECVKVL